jgi:peptidoglycan/xylan/chitin deacetylase (PgdA/CDA1 family)
VVAILAFHKVGEPPPDGWETWYYVPETTFAGYLETLAEEGWQVIGLETFLRSVAGLERLPERAALLTFDDGYQSIRGSALSVLSQFDYPAVLFVPTDYIGGRNAFDVDCEPEEAICGWDDLRELESLGISVQPHGASHRSFSELDPAEQDAELRRSKAILETELGNSVEVFSFPYGDDGADPTATALLLRRAGYRAAFLYGGGPIRLPITDSYRLARLAMGPDTDLRSMLAWEAVVRP